MAKQFGKVSSLYGAPMGRCRIGSLADIEGRLYCFKVRLDSGGYDDGGAYWGINTFGQYLYCAQDAGGNFRNFTRAASRAQALTHFLGA